MQRLNNRVQKHKEEILAELSKGYPASAVAKVLELDTRTIKRALEFWRAEDAQKALELAQQKVEDSLSK